jgi:hypothetical protein
MRILLVLGINHLTPPLLYKRIFSVSNQDYINVLFRF